eukprot:gene10268-21425_t
MKSTTAIARIVGRVGASEEFEQLDEPLCFLPVTLGRGDSSKEGDVHHVCVGKKESTVSRKHCKIFWDEEAKSFKLQCLSKNGCVVNGKLYALDEIADLQSKSAVKLGSVRFYFVLPTKKAEITKESPK